MVHWVSAEHHLNTKVCLRVFVKPCPFIATVYSSSYGCFQQDPSPCHEAQNISNGYWYSNDLHSFRSESKTAPLRCFGIGDLYHDDLLLHSKKVLGLSLWRLKVLLVQSWVLCGYSGLLPQSNNR